MNANYGKTLVVGGNGKRGGKLGVAT